MGLKLARRQERAFERLYRRHVADVYRYALVVLRDPGDAEDATQAIFVNAYRRHKHGERPSQPLNWLIGIAHDVCRRRSPSAEPHPADELDEDETAPTPADLRRALDVLPFPERTAFVMREVEGRSCAEIGELLELESGEVETLIFRARQAIREHVEASFTCHQAERAISRALDGHLRRSERKPLDAHLRSCPDCEQFARSQRGHRAALRSFRLVPVPDSLSKFRRRRFRLALVGRGAALAVTAAVVTGVLAGSVDPRRWGQDATRLEPADAATQTRPPARAVRPYDRPPIRRLP
jgi:RNA polymerase sigma-70 factor, ECF subfamily